MTVAELHAEAKARGWDVRREIITHGEPYNSYELTWQLTAWVGDGVVAIARHRDLLPAYQRLLGKKLGV